MKMYICLMTCFTIYAQDSFDFIDNKMNDALDAKFIRKIIHDFHPTVFFETGTYNAQTTINAAHYFEKIITVELHPDLFAASRKKLNQYKHVTTIHGQSPDAIRTIVPTLKGTILFWLDAHYSREGTALSFNNHEAPDAITAIRGELAAIKDTNIENCIILIDDVRDFGIEISGAEYLGCWAYPSIQEVQRDLLKINPHFCFALLGDILLAYDSFKYHPNLSKTVVACTKTRLYDGYNLSDQELLEQETIIQHASDEEKKYIKSLYNRMTDFQDPMFWHDLWYGLIELGNGNKAAAHDAFSKVKLRKQTFNKNRKHEPKNIPYNHWRIDAYLQACSQS